MLSNKSVMFLVLRHICTAFCPFVLLSEIINSVLLCLSFRTNQRSMPEGAKVNVRNLKDVLIHTPQPCRQLLYLRGALFSERFQGAPLM